MFMAAFRKITAILGLICITVFLVAFIILTLTGTLTVNSVWITGSLSAFLLFGILSIGTDRVMKHRAKQAAEADDESADSEAKHE